jgi:hypothetical protein
MNTITLNHESRVDLRKNLWTAIAILSLLIVADLWFNNAGYLVEFLFWATDWLVS